MIRGLDAPVLEALKARAAANQRSLQQELRSILVEAAQAERKNEARRRAIEEADRIRLGTEAWTVWHVPGHSPGHILLYGEQSGAVFGGDLLFAGGYGRVDLPSTDAAQMAASLRRLLQLPATTRIYPGHGPDTTAGAERGWLQDLLAAPGGLR